MARATPRKTYVVTTQGAALLEKARKARDWSYERLAKEVGVGTAAAYYNVLHGKARSFQHLPRLCKTLSVSFWRTQPLDERAIEILELLDDEIFEEDAAFEDVKWLIQLRRDAGRFRRGHSGQ